MPRPLAPPAVVVAAALLACAPAAGAAQLTPDRACYLPEMGMTVAGSGFTPNAAITLSGEGTSPLSGGADASGAFSANLEAPSAAALGATGTTPASFRLTATETASGQSATATVKVVQFAFNTDQGLKSPRALRRWRFSGFLLRPGKPIYGHFRFGGRTRATYRFGVPKGPCGTLTKHAPGIPARDVRAGTWTVQVDQNRTYKAGERLALTSKTTIFRVAR